MSVVKSQSPAVRNWKKVYATNVTTAGPIGVPSDTSEKPTTGIVWDYDGTGAGYGSVPTFVNLRFFGTDLAGETFTSKLVGWANDKQGNWSPTTIANISGVLGSETGLNTNADVTDSDLYADEITVDNGEANLLLQFGDDGQAMARLDACGFVLLQIQLAVDTAASINAQASWV